MIRITECPRDAMQGIREQIPAKLKAEYINMLLRVGFDVIDFGSFVSPKAIPQMKDTAEVLRMLELEHTSSQLLAIIANERGAGEACSSPEISFLGFPFSISETFQQRNTNSGIRESVARVQKIQELCRSANKKLLVYISMAFGNPYGDDWSPEIAVKWCREIADMGVKHIALADTVGSSTPESISKLFDALLPELKDISLGAHLHSTREKSYEKIRAAFGAGCRSFDVALHGFGGCPMAKDELTGNIATEELMHFITEQKVISTVDREALSRAAAFSWKIFKEYH